MDDSFDTECPETDIPNLLKCEVVPSSGPEFLEDVLRRFGVVSLRFEQQQAIDAVLQGEDVFLCLPTGGGKSVCYQAPSLLKGSNGLTIVISPLLSLMVNQVHLLKEMGIGCAFINSTLSSRDAAAVRQSLLAETLSIRILYITPESTKATGMIDLFHQLYSIGRIDLFAVDEAHCISSWGHSFRSSFLDLCRLRSSYPSVPILACTATATDNIANDIITTLQLRDPVKIKASFNRPNLFYKIIWACSLIRSVENDVLEFIRCFKKGRGGIVYAWTRAECERFAKFLEKHDVHVGVYHAGLPYRERQHIQRQWETSEIDVVIATIAFGMGIHREDVSFIIHVNIPTSLESYYQETGRAGRNGKPAVVLLYYSQEDERKRRFVVQKGYSDNASKYSNAKPRQISLFNEMVKLCTTAQCRRRMLLEYFGEDFKPSDPPSKECCDFCSDPKAFERARNQSQVRSSSVRSVLAIASKFKNRKNSQCSREIALVDKEDEDYGMGIYRISEKSLDERGGAEALFSKRRKLTTTITDVQRELCRRQLLQALRVNCAASGINTSEELLVLIANSIEESVFNKSSAKADYMASIRNRVSRIHSFSNALALYDDKISEIPELDIGIAHDRLKCLSLQFEASPETVKENEVSCLLNTLNKCPITIEALQSLRIGHDLNGFLKRMKAAGWSEKKQFAETSTLLARWKDIARQQGRDNS